MLPYQGANYGNTSLLERYVSYAYAYECICIHKRACNPRVKYANGMRLYQGLYQRNNSSWPAEQAYGQVEDSIREQFNDCHHNSRWVTSAVEPECGAFGLETDEPKRRRVCPILCSLPVWESLWLFDSWVVLMFRSKKSVILRYFEP